MRISEIFEMIWSSIEDFYNEGYLTYVIIALVIAGIIFLWKAYK